MSAGGGSGGGGSSSPEFLSQETLRITPGQRVTLIVGGLGEKIRRIDEVENF